MPHPAHPDGDEFAGVRFSRWSFADVRHWLARRGPADRYAYVVTPNVDHIVFLSHSGEDVQRAYADADLVLCDSRVLAKLARLAGLRLAVIPGSDLTAATFAQVFAPGDRVCLIGGGEGDDRRIEALRPGISVVQHRPPMGLRSDAAARGRAIDAAVASAARVIFFAVGSPQQEIMAREMAERADARGTGLCIGASIDFLLGRQRRAPRIARRLSLEWAWRLANDPRRLADRYLVKGPAVFPIVWRWWRTNRRR